MEGEKKLAGLHDFNLTKTCCRYKLIICFIVNRCSNPQDIFLKLNVEEAQATVEADRNKILNDIQSTIGIEAMNQVGAYIVGLVVGGLCGARRLLADKGQRGFMGETVLGDWLPDIGQPGVLESAWWCPLSTEA